MKETSEILDKLFDSIDKFTDNELNQLESLLSFDDQYIFDLFFKEKDKFYEEFHDLKIFKMNELNLIYEVKKIA